METITFTSKKGTKFIAEISNKGLIINGSLFTSKMFGFESNHPKSFLKAMGAPENIEYVKIELDKEEKKRVFGLMHPENVIKRVINEEKFWDVHDFGESFISVKKCEMMDGSIKEVRRVLENV